MSAPDSDITSTTPAWPASALGLMVMPFYNNGLLNPFRFPDLHCNCLRNTSTSGETPANMINDHGRFWCAFSGPFLAARNRLSSVLLGWSQFRPNSTKNSELVVAFSLVDVVQIPIFSLLWLVGLMGLDIISIMFLVGQSYDRKCKICLVHCLSCFSSLYYVHDVLYVRLIECHLIILRWEVDTNRVSGNVCGTRANLDMYIDVQSAVISGPRFKNKDTKSVLRCSSRNDMGWSGTWRIGDSPGG